MSNPLINTVCGLSLDVCYSNIENHYHCTNCRALVTEFIRHEHCASCGATLTSGTIGNLCPHHYAYAENKSWHIENKVYCDFIHRQIPIPLDLVRANREELLWEAPQPSPATVQPDYSDVF